MNALLSIGIVILFYELIFFKPIIESFDEEDRTNATRALVLAILASIGMIFVGLTN